MTAIAPTDRGFTLGDGLFETILARDGALIAWDAHLARLARGCAVLGLPAPKPGVAKTAALAALAAADLQDGRAAVRLSWTAGEGGRGLDRPAEPAPGLIVTVAPAPRPQGRARLAAASVRRNQGSPSSRLKSLAYLDNVLARREARALGADEAVMLNTEGEIACAAAANLFWLDGEALVTPALDCGVLDGVVRAALIERARSAGWAVREVHAPVAALARAEAVFLTNSLVGVHAASVLDGRSLAPDPRIDALAALVADLA